MNKTDALRLLIVEDNAQEIRIWDKTVKEFRHQTGNRVELINCVSFKEALEKLDGSVDGAVIDLKLANHADEGNEVAKHIEKLNFRIPVAVVTATPDNVSLDITYIGVFKKGEVDYADILDLFWDIFNTGLTLIMGGRGKIEEMLGEVFKRNLIPETYLKKWIEYGKKDSQRTERALLRHTLNHLLQFLEDNEDPFFPEEVYLVPPLPSAIQTGSIYQKKGEDNNQMFVVMNPACDLVLRDNGDEKKPNTDIILLAEIDSQKTLFPNHPPTGLTKKQQNELKKAFQNNHTLYYHWLPPTEFFDGGFLNFRKLTTILREELEHDLERLEVQISPPFVKDIVARFSTYYARQGQPDIDHEHLIDPSAAKVKNTS